MKKRVQNRKSQAALEFLMTYGWAITLVLVAIGALAYFGVLSPDKFFPRKCALEAGIGCMDFKIQEDAVTLVLRNGKGEDITISEIAVKNCTGTNYGILKNGEQKTFTVGGCTNAVDKKFIGEVNITYTGESGFVRKKTGSLVDRVESGCGLCACLNTNVSCGNYPGCNNCNNLDGYSANYCTGNDVYRDFNDYSCANQLCNPTTTPQLVQSCTNGACQNGACGCQNIDTNCGAFPSCNNCNNLDSYSANYCSGNNIYKNFSDYSCASQNCNPAITPQLVQSCTNGICQNALCSCSNTVSSCGTYPICVTCGANQICQNNQCITQTCSDGTIINQCSATKPLYCNSGLSLVNSCSTCGCPAGKVCQ